jgi:hypothetical protein
MYDIIVLFFLLSELKNLRNNFYQFRLIRSVTFSMQLQAAYIFYCMYKVLYSQYSDSATYWNGSRELICIQSIHSR